MKYICLSSVVCLPLRVKSPQFPPLIKGGKRGFKKDTVPARTQPCLTQDGCLQVPRDSGVYTRPYLEQYAASRQIYLLFIPVYLIIGLTLILTVAYGMEDQEEFVYDSANKRDPFMPLVTKDGRYLYGMPSIDIEKGGNSIVLEGILKDSKGEYFAIISGEMVKEGGKVMGLDVMEIGENKVRLSKDGEEKIYKLTEEGGGLFEKKNAD